MTDEGSMTEEDGVHIMKEAVVRYEGDRIIGRVANENLWRP